MTMKTVFKLKNGGTINATIIHEYSSFYYVITKYGYKLIGKELLIKK